MYICDTCKKKMAKLLLYFPNSCSKIKKFDYLEEKKLIALIEKNSFTPFYESVHFIHIDLVIN